MSWLIQCHGALRQLFRLEEGIQSGKFRLILIYFLRGGVPRLMLQKCTCTVVAQPVNEKTII